MRSQGEEFIKFAPKNFESQRFHYFEEVGSTNDVAFKMAQEGAEEGTVVLARTQSKGRGRMQRKWHSPEGGLWFSLILRPSLPPSCMLSICSVCALSVAKTLEESFPLESRVKWPNDVLLNGKKVCGILVEAATGLDRMDFLIVGVGLNVNVEEFPSFCKNATSLQKELGRKVRIVPLFWKLFEKIFSFYNVYKEKGFSAFRREWERYDYLKGKDVCVKVLNKVYKGKVIGVDEDGALLLDCQGRRECMLAGDVNVEKD